MKKIISVLLIVVMLLIAMPIVMVSAAPRGQAVSSVDDFKEMKATGKYYLTGDITITEPYSKYFYGTFDGNGHSITVNGAKYVFPNVQGTVKNLTVKGNITLSSNSEAAGVAASAGSETLSSANVVFDNVVSEVNITASGYTSQTYNVAGIVSKMNKGAITFINCKNKGNIAINISGEAALNVGGILGFATGAEKVTFTSCVNEGNISSKQVNTQIGGIAGYVEAKHYGSKAFPLDFYNCENKGQLSTCANDHTGIAGMVGCVYNQNSAKATTNIKDCTNSGKISSHTSAANLDMGGMVGRAYAMPHLYIENCVNSAELDNSKGSSWSGTGGMVGNFMTVGASWSWSALSASAFTIKYSTNSGTIRGNETGGIVGAGMQLGAAGITIALDSCVNTAAVYGNNYAGGIFGAVGLHEGRENFGALNFKSCYNAGFVKGMNCSAGILGYMGGSSTDANKKTTFDSCVNVGEVKCYYFGEWPLETFGAGIVAKADRAITVTGCVNTGRIQGPVGAVNNSVPITPKGAHTVTADNNLCLDIYYIKEADSFATVKANKAELAQAITSDALAIDDSALWLAFDEVDGLQGANYTQTTWDRLVRICDNGAKLLDSAQTPFVKLKQKDINKYASDIVKAKGLLETYVAE